MRDDISLQKIFSIDNIEEISIIYIDKYNIIHNPKSIFMKDFLSYFIFFK
jgi:hypothetical protein